MSGSTMKVLAVELIEENIDPKEISANGIVSSEFIRYEDMDDALLNLLWEQSPDAILEHRPEWVLRNHPKAVN